MFEPSAPASGKKKGKDSQSVDRSGSANFRRLLQAVASSLPSVVVWLIDKYVDENSNLRQIIWFVNSLALLERLGFTKYHSFVSMKHREVSKIFFLT